MSNKTKAIIVITVEGGIVQKVCAANNSDVDLEVMVIDHDDQSDDEDVVMVPYLDGRAFPGLVGFLPVDPIDFDVEKMAELTESAWENFQNRQANAYVGGELCN